MTQFPGLNLALPRATGKGVQSGFSSSLLVFWTHNGLYCSLPYCMFLSSINNKKLMKNCSIDWTLETFNCYCQKMYYLSISNFKIIVFLCMLYCGGHLFSCSKIPFNVTMVDLKVFILDMMCLFPVDVWPLF